MIRATVECKRY